MSDVILNVHYTLYILKNRACEKNEASISCPICRTVSYDAWCGHDTSERTTTKQYILQENKLKYKTQMMQWRSTRGSSVVAQQQFAYSIIFYYI
jgi:hypothetical protein